MFGADNIVVSLLRLSVFQDESQTSAMLSAGGKWCTDSDALNTYTEIGTAFIDEHCEHVDSIHV
jgi:hypothetical protein